jgi:integrase
MRLLMGIVKDRHGTYYARKKVPPHLEQAVARVLNNDKQRQVWLKRSLGTKDLREANKRVLPVIMEFDRTLARAETLVSERPLRTSLSKVEIKHMADWYYATRLASHDEFIRIAPEIEQEFRDEFPDETWPGPVPEFGLSGGHLADWAENGPSIVREAEAALGKGDIGHIGLQLDELLETHHIDLDRKSASYRELGLQVLRAHVKALHASQKRMAGEPIETPQVPSTLATRNVPATGDTLIAALEGWKRQRQRAPGTLTEYERAIELFTELHGDIHIIQIKRTHARQFREALQDVPARRSGKLLGATLSELAQWGREHPDVPKITAGTINKRLTAVQAIANWARDNGMIPDDVQWADPFRRMRLGEEEAVRGGAPFEITDLQVIFGTSVFTEGERPTGGKGEAAFWLPLLALFTGARLNELASLRASEVAQNEIIGEDCIFIKADRRSGKRLKTERSERFVPLHPQLIAAGFLQFVADQQAEHGANAWLFPKLAPGTTGKAGFSKWFGRYIGAHGITDGTKVFHSFRHTFVDALRLAGVGDEINIALLGHTDPSVHDKYGAKDKAMRFRHRLAEAVASVAYTGLDLSHLNSHRTTHVHQRPPNA